MRLTINGESKNYLMKYIPHRGVHDIKIFINKEFALDKFA